MAKISIPQRIITKFRLEAERETLSICQIRAQKYVSEQTVARLLAALPHNGKGNPTRSHCQKPRSITGPDLFSIAGQGDESEGPPADAQVHQGQDEGTSAYPPSPSSASAYVSLDRQNSGEASPSSYRTGGQWLEDYHKLVFDHKVASRAWAASREFARYLNMLDAAKAEAEAQVFRSASQESPQHQSGKSSEEETGPRLCISAVDFPRLMIDPHLFRPAGEMTAAGTTDEEPASSQLDEELPPSQADTASSASDDYKSSRSTTPDPPPLAARRTYFQTTNSLEAMTYRRLVAHFRQHRDKAKPVTFAQMMKLQLCYSRVAHQLKQLEHGLNLVFARTQVHPRRNLRAFFHHDIALVMKSEGMSSRLSESISADERWPDAWDDAIPVRRRKLHGLGAYRPGMVSKSKESGVDNTTALSMDRVKW